MPDSGLDAVVVERCAESVRRCDACGRPGIGRAIGSVVYVRPEGVERFVAAEAGVTSAAPNPGPIIGAGVAALEAEDFGNVVNETCGMGLAVATMGVEVGIVADNPRPNGAGVAIPESPREGSGSRKSD